MRLGTILSGETVLGLQHCPPPSCRRGLHEQPTPSSKYPKLTRMPLEQNWDVSEFNRWMTARAEGPGRQGLETSIWLGDLPICLRNEDLRKLLPRLSGRGYGNSAERTSSIVISSVRRKWTRSRVEEKRLSGFQIIFPGNFAPFLNWLVAAWVQTRHQERTLLKINERGTIDHLL